MQKLRKILLSFLVIGSFSLYVFYSKPETIWNYATPVENPLPKKTPVANVTYKNGEYEGSNADAYYGYIKVRATVEKGKLADIIFLDYPQDRETSIMINDYAMPILKTEAIAAQSAEVDVVSGATDSSKAFRESLADALLQAKI